jgi:hypothetical protein
MKLETQQELSQANPRIQTLFKFDLCTSYDLFIELLYEILQNIIQLIEDSSHLYQVPDIEETITAHLLTPLQFAGIRAYHNRLINGNVDLTIEVNNYRWLGEAKVYRQTSSAEEGFAQLVTRYSKGRSTESKCGLILYLYENQAKTKMDNWHTHLKSLGYKDLTTKTGNDRLCFYSNHTHEVSGLPFECKHLPVLLNFNPKDKSARSAKKYKKP